VSIQSGMSQPPARTIALLMLIVLAAASVAIGYFASPHGSKNPLEAAQQDFREGYGAAAARLFSPLADAGNATAQYWLADIYLDGYDVKAYPGRAIELLTKAASGGFVPAELRLGEIYLNGHVVLQNFVQAKTWLTKAALTGDTIAERDLGQMYERGWGVDADMVEAYAWYAAAAAGGNRLAQDERDHLLNSLRGDAVARAQARAVGIDGAIKAPVPAKKS
jgi:TPR repeat protein